MGRVSGTAAGRGWAVSGEESATVRELMLALEALRFACEHAEGKNQDDSDMLTAAMSLGIRKLEKHKGLVSDFQRESYWDEVRLMTHSND